MQKFMTNTSPLVFSCSVFKVTYQNKNSETVVRLLMFYLSL